MTSFKEKIGRGGLYIFLTWNIWRTLCFNIVPQYSDPIIRFLKGQIWLHTYFEGICQFSIKIVYFESRSPFFNIDASFEISAKQILSKVGRTEEMFSNWQDLHIIGNTSLHLNVNAPVFSTRLSSRFSFQETFKDFSWNPHQSLFLIVESITRNSENWAILYCQMIIFRQIW